jgi:branched-chain amino acid aminotransferase
MVVPKLGRFAFFEGRIRPYQEARIPVATSAFNYGTACFEGIRFFWDKEKKKIKILALKEHFQRLFQSAKILGIELIYNLEEVVQITLELLKKENWQENGYIRPIAYKADETIGVKLSGIKSEITIFTTSFGSYYRDEEDVRAMISSIRRIDDSSIPARAKITGAYVNSALAKMRQSEPILMRQSYSIKMAEWLRLQLPICLSSEKGFYLLPQSLKTS